MCHLGLRHQSLCEAQDRTGEMRINQEGSRKAFWISKGSLWAPCTSGPKQAAEKGAAAHLSVRQLPISLVSAALLVHLTLVSNQEVHSPQCHFPSLFSFRWGILFSHPRDFTPVCTTELGRAAKLAPEFSKRNVKMIALSIDSVQDHLAWCKVLWQQWTGYLCVRVTCTQLPESQAYRSDFAL